MIENKWQQILPKIWGLLEDLRESLEEDKPPTEPVEKQYLTKCPRCQYYFYFRDVGKPPDPEFITEQDKHDERSAPYEDADHPEPIKCKIPNCGCEGEAILNVEPSPERRNERRRVMIERLDTPNKGIYPWEDDMFADYILENRKKLNELIDYFNEAEKQAIDFTGEPLVKPPDPEPQCPTCKLWKEKWEMSVSVEDFANARKEIARLKQV